MCFGLPFSTAISSLFLAKSAGAPALRLRGDQLVHVLLVGRREHVGGRALLDLRLEIRRRAEAERDFVPGCAASNSAPSAVKPFVSDDAASTVMSPSSWARVEVVVPLPAATVVVVAAFLSEPHAAATSPTHDERDTHDPKLAHARSSRGLVSGRLIAVAARSQRQGRRPSPFWLAPRSAISSRARRPRDRASCPRRASLRPPSVRDRRATAFGRPRALLRVSCHSVGCARTVSLGLLGSFGNRSDLPVCTRSRTERIRGPECREAVRGYQSAGARDGKSTYIGGERDRKRRREERTGGPYGLGEKDNVGRNPRPCLVPQQEGEAAPRRPGPCRSGRGARAGDPAPAKTAEIRIAAAEKRVKKATGEAARTEHQLKKVKRAQAARRRHRGVARECRTHRARAESRAPEERR